MHVPHAFICHASEDKPTVSILARGLMENGVDVFFDEWEIGPGDSIRQRIDEGLRKCTHFLVVLSAASINKPWVNAEIDGGFIKKIQGQAAFIPVRIGLSVSQIPELLQGMNSPAIGDPIEDAKTIAGYIHGIHRKPPLGPVPSAISTATPRSGLSLAAETIARLIAEKSKKAMVGDPQFTPDVIMKQCGLAEDDMAEGVDELVQTGRIRKLDALGQPHFAVIWPESTFFVAYDSVFGIGNPKEDARRLAIEIVNSGNDNCSVSTLSEITSWTPRRINPAVEYLVSHHVVKGLRAMSPDWTAGHLTVSPSIRRFARGDIG